MKAEYQPANLYAPSNGTWRIFWYNEHPETRELTRIQKTFGLNRIKSPVERRKAAIEHMYLLNLALKRGFNYFVDTLGYAPNRNTEDYISVQQLVTDMLPIRCAGKKKRTIDSYRSYNNNFLKWLADSKLATQPADKFTAAHFQKFITEKIKQGSNNRTINDYITFIRTSFKKAVAMDYIYYNPIDKVDMLPKEESSRFATITNDELLRIGIALRQHNIRYYIYTVFTALEFIRPYHISFIKAGDIDYQNNQIRITSEGSKNRKVKYKQLLPHLKKLLIDNDYHKLPSHYYIFSRKFEPSEEQHINLSKRSSEVWKQVVKTQLGINKKMYALKHTAGQFYVNENETLDAGWLQHQMEHSSLRETEAYIQTRKNKIIDTSKVKMIKY